MASKSISQYTNTTTRAIGDEILIERSNTYFKTDTFTIAPKRNVTATAAPTVNDDSTMGYSLGSIWVDVNNDDFYICVDASVGAAVWSSGGGGGGGGTTFADNVFRIQDDGDATKEIAFQASGITTGTVRTITMPDADVNLGQILTSASNITDNFVPLAVGTGRAMETSRFFDSGTLIGIGASSASATSTEDIAFSGNTYWTASNVGIDGQVTVGRGVTDYATGGGSEDFEVITTTANSKARFGHNLVVSGITNSMGLQFTRQSSSSYSVANFIGSVNTNDFAVAGAGYFYFYTFNGTQRARIGMNTSATMNFGDNTRTSSLVNIAGTFNVSTFSLYDNEGLFMTVGGDNGNLTTNVTPSTSATACLMFVGQETLDSTSGANTITDAAALRVSPMTAGTNITFTNNYAIWCEGDLRVDGNTTASSSGASGTFLDINVGGTAYKLDLHTP